MKLMSQLLRCLFNFNKAKLKRIETATCGHAATCVGIEI